MTNYRYLLLVPVFRRIICWARFIIYYNLLKRFESTESDSSLTKTIQHNFKSLSNFKGGRITRILKPLSAIEAIDANDQVLIIGPRNENDIFLALGFFPQIPSKNFHGLDLMSYSPYITVGDMHKTTFHDAYFNIIICGWTLSYSNKPKDFAREIIRISKNNCLLAIAVQYSSEELIASDTGVCGENINDYIVDSGYKIRDSQSILELFSGHVNHVYFEHDAPLKISHQSNKYVHNPSSVCVVFSLKK